MSFHFSSVPPNFQRFLDLTRSGSRSLSPENELKQMTVSSTAGSHIKQVTMSGCSNTFPSNSRPAQLRQTPYDYSLGSTVSIKESSSSLEGDHFVKMEGAFPRDTAKVQEDYSESRSFSDVEGPGTASHEVMNELVEEFRNFSLWQYGSPFYYPVTDQFYCWNLHPLQLKHKSEYQDLDGISCDFCGYTEWLVASTKPEPISMPLDNREISSHKNCVTSRIETLSTDTQYESKQKHMKEEDVVLEAPELRTVFHHCSVCGIDLCAACIADIRSDDRYHAPCRQCLRCKVYFSHQQAAAHRCRGLKPVGRAVFIKEEEAVIEKVGIQGQALSRDEGRFRAREELLSTSGSYNSCKAATQKRTKVVRGRDQRLLDRPRGVPAPRVEKPNPVSLVSSSVGGRVIEMKSSLSALQPERWTELEHDLTVSYPAGGPKPQEESSASEMAPPLESGWEVCITASTAKAAAQAEWIIKRVSMQPVCQEGGTAQEVLYMSKLSTRLAAENCARLAREAGLLVSLRKI